jgi:hypothetical protein
VLAAVVRSRMARGGSAVRRRTHKKGAPRRRRPRKEPSQ